MNFFHPTMKLLDKTRQGAKVHKVYETVQTPYQLLLESGVISEAKRAGLSAIYHGLNPVTLLKQINANLQKLWRLAQHAASFGNRNYEAKRRGFGNSLI